MGNIVKEEVCISSRLTSYELRVPSCELQVENVKARVEVQKCEF